MAWLAGMELDEIIALTVGQVVDFVVGTLAAASRPTVPEVAANGLRSTSRRCTGGRGRRRAAPARW